MKTASVREVRNQFSKISAWLENGETVQILKRGKPVGRIIPEQHKQVLLGAMEGTGSLPSDLESSIDLDWEATR
jgi:antitoxin (DNA-binding transcriptional repressor) of toxin-antitoxin stability system